MAGMPAYKHFSQVALPVTSSLCYVMTSWVKRTEITRYRSCRWSEHH